MKRIVLNISIEPGNAGGVQQFATGLVQSLSDVSTPNLEFVVVTDPDHPDWLKQYARSDMKFVPRGTAKSQQWTESLLNTIKTIGRPILKRQTVTNQVRSVLRGEPQVPDADGFFESLGADVVHFPFPPYERTELPTIFNPHDHQHLHFPGNFPPRTTETRKIVYRVGCEDSVAVDVPSQFVKNDTLDHYDVDAENIHVITRGPPTVLYDTLSDTSIERTRRKYDVPERFVFYPAQTWPHKNHARLVDALGQLRDERDERLHLVCTGMQIAAGWDPVEHRLEERLLHDQVSFLGFVDHDVVRALYRLSEFVVLPSYFEGGGFLPLEAWHEGTPIACSNVTSLPEKVGDAALLFDPHSVDEIADALYRMHKDAELRDSLREKGHQRLKEFTWYDTGVAYRALYRKVAGLPLNKEDRRALDRSSGTVSAQGGQ